MNKKITNLQIRKIFALKKEKGMTEDELYLVLGRVSTKGSIKALSQKQANKLIDELVGDKYKISKNQEKYILGLTEELGWSIEGLVGFIQKKFNRTVSTDDIFSSVDKTLASKIIEALKVIKRRKESEK